jgi:hypothetical protein
MSKETKDREANETKDREAKDREATVIVFLGLVAESADPFDDTEQPTQGGDLGRNHTRAAMVRLYSDGKLSGSLSGVDWYSTIIMSTNICAKQLSRKQNKAKQRTPINCARNNRQAAV